MLPKEHYEQGCSSITLSLYTVRLFRGVAQLVERGIWDAEVAGSTPVTPTRVRNEYHTLCGNIVYESKHSVMSQREHPHPHRTNPYLKLKYLLSIYGAEIGIR